MGSSIAVRDVIRQHRKAFIVMCALFYGGMALVMVVTMFAHHLKPWASSWYDVNLLADWNFVQSVFAAYANGHVIEAATRTFLWNFFFVAILMTTLPSLIIPFIGIIPVYYRGLLLGAMFAPFGIERVTFIPHMPTAVVECFAYLLAAFGAYVHGVMILSPQRYGFATRGEAYRQGFAIIARLYVWILLLLLIAAIYEAFEVIYLVPLFAQALAA